MDNILIPSGWNEVTVGMFQEMANLDKTEEGLTKIVDLISILSDKDPEDIKKINSTDLDPILEAIKWSGEMPSDEYKTEIEINGVTYYLIKLSSASIAENVDLESYQGDITQLHKFFAVLYRPANEEYEVDKMNERAELFKEKLMISDVFGTLVFFLSIPQRYDEIIKVYSKKQTQTMT